MADQSEWKKLRRELERQGCRIERGKHFKVYRGNELVTSIPTTSGDRRAALNQRAQLRRKGIAI